MSACLWLTHCVSYGVPVWNVCVNVSCVCDWLIVFLMVCVCVKCVCLWLTHCVSYGVPVRNVCECVCAFVTDSLCFLWCACVWNVCVFVTDSLCFLWCACVWNVCVFVTDSLCFLWCACVKLYASSSPATALWMCIKNYHLFIHS